MAQPGINREPQKVGTWNKVAILGSGGFGTVSLWRCNETEDSIAIKKCKLHCHTSLTKKQKERWCKEVDIIQTLNHPNIVKYKTLPKNLEAVLNEFNPTKLPLLPMEYCQKGNLRHILCQPLNLRGLKETPIKYILEDISNAVKYLHSLNITHRDIKPENIVLDECSERPNGIVYKLIDLGYAKELNDSTVSFVGTLHYLAPEIFSNQNYDHKVDYWSLGILTFEIICGVLPFCPSLNYVERYRMIKEKKPDDICIFKTKDGNFQYSTELLKENHINSCFKQRMEVWLRQALNFEPKLRFSKSNIFNDLNIILVKKVVTVFSVYNYEFYSYEFNFERLQDLRQWIIRDTGIEKENLLLLGFKDTNYVSEDELRDMFDDGNYEVFVFNRARLFSGEIKHQIPRFLKILFEKTKETFKWKDVKPIYSDSLYYISRDILLASYFSEAMDLLINHLETSVKETVMRGNSMKQHAEENINEYIITLKGCPINREVATDTKREFYSTFFAHLKRCIQLDFDARTNIAKMNIKVEVIRKKYLKLDLVKLSQLEESLQKAIQILQKSAENSSSNNDLSIAEMSKLISDVMKQKTKLLCDKSLNELFGLIGKTEKHSENIYCWIFRYDLHFLKLDSIIQQYVEIQNVSKSRISSNKPQSEESVLEKSEFLISKFIEDLKETETCCKEMCEDVSLFLTDAFTESSQ